MQGAAHICHHMERTVRFLRWRDRGPADRELPGLPVMDVGNSAGSHDWWSGRGGQRRRVHDGGASRGDKRGCQGDESPAWHALRQTSVASPAWSTGSTRGGDGQAPRNVLHHREREPGRGEGRASEPCALKHVCVWEGEGEKREGGGSGLYFSMW